MQLVFYADNICQIFCLQFLNWCAPIPTVYYVNLKEEKEEHEFYLCAQVSAQVPAYLSGRLGERVGDSGKRRPQQSPGGTSRTFMGSNCHICSFRGIF